MADEKKSPVYEAGVLYKFRVVKVAEYQRATFRPRASAYQADGEVLTALAGAVDPASVEPVEGTLAAANHAAI